MSLKRIVSKLLGGPRQTELNGELVRLTRLVRLYAIEQQQVPKEMADLVNLKYLPAVPIAPQGQRFIIDRRRVEVRLE